jgi:hypothetical protein
VLSIVTVNGRRGKWTPFFFRDIAPVGWNIALGSSEGEDELTIPWRFLLREFLEETLIHTNDPSGASISRAVKTFEVGSAPDGFRVERKKANRFALEHREMRNEMDSLALKPMLNDENHIIPCKIADTRTDIQIIKRNGEWTLPWKNVLVCFNLLELGIEVVKVLEYNLSEADEFLDGEILNKCDNEKNETWKELVRMPVALISHSFLKRVFGNLNGHYKGYYPELFEIQDGEMSKAPIRVKQPSILPESKIDPNSEIIIFQRDAIRRKEIVDGVQEEDLSIHPSDRRAYDRHRCWLKNFKKFFFNSDGEPLLLNPVPWFTPASAKIMSYYFANT